MAKAIPIPRAGESIIGFHRRNPGAIRDAFLKLRLLDNMEVRPVAGSTANQGRNPVVASDTNLVIPIPVVFPRAVAALTVYSGGTAGVGYTQAQIQALMDNLASANAKINEMQLQLTSAGLNPH
jgi:hypothetical protein